MFSVASCFSEQVTDEFMVGDMLGLKVLLHFCKQFHRIKRPLIGGWSLVYSLKGSSNGVVEANA